MSELLKAYCLKTKQKEEMNEAVVTKTERGGYIAKGVNKDGLKLSLILSKDNAEKAISDGVAKKGF